MSPRVLKGLWLGFVVLWGLIIAINGELHRAKPAKKHGPSLTVGGSGSKIRFPPGPFADYDNEAVITGDKTSLGDETQDKSNMTRSGHSTETWIYSLVSAGLVGLSGIFPLLVIPLEVGKALRHGVAAARLKLLLSFAVGGLLGDVFLHLLPEAWAHLDKVGADSHQAHTQIGLWIITGIFAFLIIEKIFPEGVDDDDEDDKEEEDADTEKIHQTTIKSEPMSQIVTRSQQKSKKKSSPTTTAITTTTRNRKQKSQKNGVAITNGHVTNGNAHISNGHATPKESTGENKLIKSDKKTTIKTSGWLNLLANVIDNFTYGLAVARSYCISTKTGLITTSAVLLHEVPHKVGDFAILLRSGFDRWKAAKAQLVTASGGMLGALVALCSETAEAAGDRTAWILPFTSGGFIYIALVTVVPDLLKENNIKQSVLQVGLILLGIVMVSGVTLLCE